MIGGPYRVNTGQKVPVNRASDHIARWQRYLIRHVQSPGRVDGHGQLQRIVRRLRFDILLHYTCEYTEKPNLGCTNLDIDHKAATVGQRRDLAEHSLVGDTGRALRCRHRVGLERRR